MSQRILVVDDEPSIVDAVGTALRYEGFEVEEAGTGRDALQAVTQREPDLIVLDWMLPDIDGLEVGRRLRERGFKIVGTRERLGKRDGVWRDVLLVERRSDRVE